MEKVVTIQENASARKTFQVTNAIVVQLDITIFKTIA